MPLLGFLLRRGPCNARGPWVCWTGSQCGPVVFVTLGASFAPWFLGFWCVAVGDGHDCRRGSFGLFLSSVFHLLSLHLCLPTEIRRCIFSLPIVTIQYNFSLVLLLPDSIFLLNFCLPVSRVYPIMVDSFSGRI